MVGGKLRNQYKRSGYGYAFASARVVPGGYGYAFASARVVPGGYGYARMLLGWLLICFVVFLLLPMRCASARSAQAEEKPHGSMVSFAPSDTELVYSIGAQDRLVGVCSYCDYPQAAKSKDKVGTFVSANLERLARLKPDTVLLVSGQEPLAASLKHNGFHTLIIKNETLIDIGKNLRALGEASGHAEHAQKIAASFDQSLAQLARITSKSGARPKVFYCVWPQPLLTVGKASYLNDAITICGGDNISATMPPAYPHYSAEKLMLEQPSIIVLPSHQETLLKKEPWSSLTATKNHKVFISPDAEHDGLARPTLRIIEGLYWLSVKLHPEVMPELDKWHKDAGRVY